MSALLWTAFVILELVLVVLAVIGICKIREDIHRRDYGLAPLSPPDPWGLEAPRGHAVSDYAAFDAQPASQRAERPKFSMPSSPKRRTTPGPRHYLQLRVDNGPVPGVRSKRSFAGNLKSVS